jgi:predicted amidohydrolase
MPYPYAVSGVNEDMMRRLRLGAVQTKLHPSNEHGAVEAAVTLIRDAASKGASLVSLPEHWLIDKVVGAKDGIYDRFSRLAEDLGIYLNLGGIYEKEIDVHLTSPTFAPDGEMISNQRKVHLYRRENKKAKPGSSLTPFRGGNFVAGTLVCHDVVFPEAARTLVLRGAEILLNPSLIVSSGMEPWEVYVTARALENRVPLVAPNALHKDLFRGGSLIVTLHYNRKQNVMEVVKRRAKVNDEDVITADVELESLGEHRSERFAERRPDSYDQT